ncbi:MAG TPA: hypothetical protein VMY59_09835 [Candidatus Thermoplasmatota archaeon]|nr:hypothetical protein [Candidatus Thermoplasmatota archaeon]
MNEKKKRFHVGMRLHIRDNLFGDAMVMNTNANGDGGSELIEQMQRKAEETVSEFRKIEGHPSSQQIEKHIKTLVEDKWSRKRIISHFASFGIIVDDFKELPPEKSKKKSKKLPVSQKKIDDL